MLELAQFIIRPQTSSAVKLLSVTRRTLERAYVFVQNNLCNLVWQYNIIDV